MLRNAVKSKCGNAQGKPVLFGRLRVKKAACFKVASGNVCPSLKGAGGGYKLAYLI